MKTTIDYRDISFAIKDRDEKELDATKEYQETLNKSLSTVKDINLMVMTDAMAKSLTRKTFIR